MATLLESGGSRKATEPARGRGLQSSLLTWSKRIMKTKEYSGGLTQRSQRTTDHASFSQRVKSGPDEEAIPPKAGAPRWDFLSTSVLFVSPFRIGTILSLCPLYLWGVGQITCHGPPDQEKPLTDLGMRR